MKKRLNKKIREDQIVNFIVKFIDKNGYSPTTAEVAQELGLSLQQVFNISKGLIEKGRIRKTDDRNRKFVVINK